MPQQVHIDDGAENVRKFREHGGRGESEPFEIVLNGNIAALNRAQLQDKLLPLIDAGVTWWIEGLWDATEEVAVERIRRGPPSTEM
jgi:hypothetical protein